jgi:hypothetical protein
MKPSRLPLPPDAEIELRVFLSRVQRATEALGQSDFQVAVAERNRDAARTNLWNASQLLQQFVADVAKRLDVVGWPFDPVARSFVRPPEPPAAPSAADLNGHAETLVSPSPAEPDAPRDCETQPR